MYGSLGVCRTRRKHFAQYPLEGRHGFGYGAFRRYIVVHCVVVAHLVNGIVYCCLLIVASTVVTCYLLLLLLCCLNAIHSAQKVSLSPWFSAREDATPAAAKAFTELLDAPLDRRALYRKTDTRHRARILK